MFKVFCKIFCTSSGQLPFSQSLICPIHDILFIYLQYLQDTIVCLDGHCVRLNNHRGINPGRVSVATGNAMSMTLTNHLSRPCASLQVVREVGRENKCRGSIRCVYQRVRATCHPISQRRRTCGELSHDAGKYNKSLTCQASGGDDVWRPDRTSLFFCCMSHYTSVHCARC